jgi:hypothetical protein
MKEALMMKTTTGFLLLTVAVTARADTSAWQKKIDAFQDQVREQRKKLGLKNDQRGATPELAFVTAPGEATSGTVVLCAGQTVDVKLKTNLPANSLFVVTNDDVTIAKQKLEGGVWSATLTARANALPRGFSVRGLNPTSGREASLWSFLLACKHTLVTEVGGDTLTLKLDFSTGQQAVQATGAWTRAGQKPIPATFEVRMMTEGISANRVPSPEEQQAEVAAMTKAYGSPERRAAEKKLEEAVKKMEPCMKLAPEKMQACMAPVQKEVDAVNARMQQLNDDAERTTSPKIGCGELQLSYGADATLKGEGSRCQGKKADERLDAKATITAP